jgi:hypothetical protein
MWKKLSVTAVLGIVLLASSAVCREADNNLFPANNPNNFFSLPDYDSRFDTLYPGSIGYNSAFPPFNIAVPQPLQDDQARSLADGYELNNAFTYGEPEVLEDDTDRLLGEEYYDNDGFNNADNEDNSDWIVADETNVDAGNNNNNQKKPAQKKNKPKKHPRKRRNNFRNKPQPKPQPPKPQPQPKPQPPKPKPQPACREPPKVKCQAVPSFGNPAALLSAFLSNFNYNLGNGAAKWNVVYQSNTNNLFYYIFSLKINNSVQYFGISFNAKTNQVISFGLAGSITQVADLLGVKCAAANLNIDCGNLQCVYNGKCRPTEGCQPNVGVTQAA